MTKRRGYRLHDQIAACVQASCRVFRSEFIALGTADKPDLSQDAPSIRAPSSWHEARFLQRCAEGLQAAREGVAIKAERAQSFVGRKTAGLERGRAGASGANLVEETAEATGKARSAVHGSDLLIGLSIACDRKIGFAAPQ